MLTLPNLLSLLRIPLALVFLHANPFYRAIAIVLAMASDCLDGYLARKYKQISKVGTMLDPITDKLFVFMALAILLEEHRLNYWEAAAMICRDFSVIAFGFYLAFKGNLSNYTFRAIWCGKITTAFQFLVLLCLTFGYTFPSYVYGSFFLLGLLALVELYLTPQIKSPVQD